jgi:hypothetical protein
MPVLMGDRVVLVAARRHIATDNQRFAPNRSEEAMRVNRPSFDA